jgi:hypothetical protein
MDFSECTPKLNFKKELLSGIDMSSSSELIISNILSKNIRIHQFLKPILNYNKLLKFKLANLRLN